MKDPKETGAKVQCVETDEVLKAELARIDGWLVEQVLVHDGLAVAVGRSAICGALQQALKLGQHHGLRCMRSTLAELEAEPL